VSNHITIKSETVNLVEKTDIENALRRNWAIADKDITVEVTDHNVTLTGMVDSSYQKEEAERIAWNAPGVQKVDNKLGVEYFYSLLKK
jgi:osmotically-inducible protein OsmY